MAVEQFEDLRPYLARVREKVWEAVAACPPERLRERPAPGAWSVLEHVEHLALTEPYLVAIVEDLVRQGRAADLTRTPDTPRTVNALLVLAAAAGRKFQAPSHTQPRGEDDLPGLRNRLDASRARLLAALEAMEPLDSDRLLARHVFGWELNAAQWVHFAGIHESLHTRHIRNVLEALAAC